VLLRVFIQIRIEILYVCIYRNTVWPNQRAQFLRNYPKNPTDDTPTTRAKMDERYKNAPLARLPSRWTMTGWSADCCC